jgi:PAS domain S-box-containing protein
MFFAREEANTIPDAERGMFPTWPIGGGQMGALIRALDWTQTPLGPIEGWPQSLRSALAICLGSSSAIGIYWGRDLTLLYNDAWRELIGEKHPSALGRPAREVFPEIWETIGPMFARVLSTGEATRAQERRLPLYRHGFREECYFDYTANPIPSEDGGSVGGIFNIAVEVTDRVRTQKALRDSEARYRGIVDQATVGIAQSDLTGKLTFVNDRFCEIVGRSREELLGGLRMQDITHEEDLPRNLVLFKRLIEDRAEFSIEKRFVRPDGEHIWIENEVTLVHGADGRPLYAQAITQDITERRQAEEERARLRALELSVRAETRERERISRELHDRVAHTMGVAHQSLQLYETYARSDLSRAAQKLELAKEATRAALEQTRDLAAELARSHEEETRDGVVAALHTLLQTHVPPGVETTLSASGDESSVPAPVGEQVYLVMREAVRNAVAHSGCRRIKVGLEVRREEISGYVEDDGSGFDPDEVGEDGSPYWGVGISSMRERTELLDGELRIASKRGGGTRVEILVPLGGESEG